MIRNPRAIIQASVARARGNAVRAYLNDHDREALRRREEFAAEVEKQALEMIAEQRGRK